VSIVLFVKEILHAWTDAADQACARACADLLLEGNSVNVSYLAKETNKTNIKAFFARSNNEQEAQHFGESSTGSNGRRNRGHDDL
jgi:hypothetical protein